MVKIKDLAPYSWKGAYSPFVEFQNLLFNGVKITGVDYKTEKTIKSYLFDGAVGYDKITNKWSAVSGIGIDEDGFPKQLIFTYKNGKQVQRSAYYNEDENGAYIIYATPNGLSFNDMILKTACFMENCDKAINQNIDACKMPYVIAVKDKDLRESVYKYIEEKEDGKPVIIVDEGFAENIKVLNLSCEYMADQFTTLKYDERDRLLNKLGIMSANTDKRERVQVGEVNATVGQCTDYIYLLIDTFNKQMESYGLHFRMEANGSLEELYYTDEDVKENNEEKSAEKETK